MNAAAAAIREATSRGLAASAPWRIWESAATRAAAAQQALDDVATISPDNGAVQVVKAVPALEDSRQRLAVLRAALEAATADAATPLAGIALRVLAPLKDTPEERPAAQAVLTPISTFLRDLAQAGADPRWALQRAAAGLPCLDASNRAALALTASAFTKPTDALPNPGSRVLATGLDSAEQGAIERGAAAEADAIRTLRRMADAVPSMRPVTHHAILRALKDRVPATPDQLAATGHAILERIGRTALAVPLLDGIERLALASGDRHLVPPLVEGIRKDPSTLDSGLQAIAATRFDRTVLAAETPHHPPAVRVDNGQVTIAGIPLQRRERQVEPSSAASGSPGKPDAAPESHDNATPEARST